MKHVPARWLGFVAVLAAALGCNLPGVAPTLTPTEAPTETPRPTVTATATITPTATYTPTSTPIPSPVFNEYGVRICDYVPGVSVVAEMPPDVVAGATPTPFPLPTAPAPSSVDEATTQRQRGLYSELWNIVNNQYVDPAFGGRDWEAIGARYEAMIEEGLTDEDFYNAMNLMIADLGDEHSYYIDAEQVAEEEEIMAGMNDFVGIGTYAQAIGDGEQWVILSVLPNSPAAEAGFRSHDVMLAVNGGPVADELSLPRTLGPEGTEVTVTVQRPGEQPRDVVLIRRRITGSIPIDYCLVQDTRIGYIFIPTLIDGTIDDQMRTALQQMTADGPMDGLVLDNRMNGGGLSTVLQPMLGFFTSGVQGYFVSRSGRSQFYITPEDIGGSQTVPLVVLIDTDTASFGEISSGVLGNTERATLMGEPTLGNVEQLRGFTLSDGSMVWLATDTFEPTGLSAGVWEELGIVPDVVVPSRWDLFTEANDPGLAMAVEYLTGE